MMVSFRNFQRIHLVGIGGIGMSGIAEVLRRWAAVSGSDANPRTSPSGAGSARRSGGHKATNVETRTSW